MFLILTLFFVKHFICDFVLQKNRMIDDKGIYGAPGGRDHAATHALGTTIVLFLVFPWDLGAHVAAIVLGAIDGVIHYHIDWAKTNITKGLTPQDKAFWVWLGADQMLHYLTYIIIVAIIFL